MLEEGAEAAMPAGFGRYRRQLEASSRAVTAATALGRLEMRCLRRWSMPPAPPRREYRAAMIRG